MSAFFVLFALAPAFAGQNKIGTATLTVHACDATGLSGGNCYRVVVSDCPETTGEFAAAVKINQPPSTASPRGTLFLTTGGLGDAFYDYDSSFLGDSRCSGSNCGLMVVQSLNAANYRTVQIKFIDPENLIQEPSGWLTGPSALARGASLAAMQPSCMLLGSLAQQGQCTPSLSPPEIAGVERGHLRNHTIRHGKQLGTGANFTLAEPTSGPPLARLDQGCAGAATPILRRNEHCPAGSQISTDYRLATASDYIDPAYPSDICTTDINSNGTQPYAKLRHDSVLSDDFAVPSYKTVVRSLFGSDDLTSAVPLGQEWCNAIKSSKSGVCIAGAPHELPGNFDGASAIVSDISTLCK